MLDFYKSWYCNRGIRVQEGMLEDSERNEVCFCPPAYHGFWCQYQSQRVSLTLKFRKESAHHWRTIYALLIMLVDSSGKIHSHEQITYLPSRDCGVKYNINLLYEKPSKDLSIDYFVRLDAYDKRSLTYFASWQFNIQYNFLPVNRLAMHVEIPSHSYRNTEEMYVCNLNCHHGRCILFADTRHSFCRCDENWTGSYCDTKQICKCSPNSLCVGAIDNRSICICPAGRFGSRCYLTRSNCQPTSCRYHGECVPTDERLSEEGFICICHEGFSGKSCEFINTRTLIDFSRLMEIPSAVLIHFIRAYEDQPHSRLTFPKKIAFNESSVTLYTDTPFHVVFIECDSNYYLSYVQETYTYARNISLIVETTSRCVSVDKLFNLTILAFPLLRRLKYYHIPCEEQLELRCFLDNAYMCLCNEDRNANCFEFERYTTYDCQNSSYCANGIHCFQDDLYCPTSSVCVCPECFYGSKCQFHTKTFGLSLNTILGYHIHPQITLSQHPPVIKAAIAMSVLVTTIGLISNILALLTFKTKTLREVGCGVYLFAASVTSTLTIIFFTLEFWFFILSQKVVITHYLFLQINCVVMDYLPHLCLSIGDWLSACVAIERLITVRKGVQFNKRKSKLVAKWIITAVVLFNILSTVYDPIHRRLVVDEEEERTWCVTQYSPSFQVINATIILGHFIIPFFINLLSAVIIIIAVAQRRSLAQQQKTYREHLRNQLLHQKHHLITPLILTTFAMPRLIISFLSKCMKSTHDPWLYLTGYFISFLPSTFLFFVFVLPSKAYMETFNRSIRRFSITV